MKKDNTVYHLEQFVRTLLHKNTIFTIKKVYEYDTFPAYSIISKDHTGFEEEWQEKFEEVFNMFQNTIEHTLQMANLMDNKIAIQIDWTIPGYREGCKGTILWCHKDLMDGFFFGCNPNTYVKDNLNITFGL